MLKERFAAFPFGSIKEFIRQLKKETSSSTGRIKKKYEKILDCSNGKLQAVRISRKLRWNKAGSTLYYSREDVQKIIYKSNV